MVRGHPDAVEWDAARLALLALRGNIHPSRTLTADAYAVLPRRGVVRTAEATLPTLVAADKPLVCRGYASGGTVMVCIEPPSVGGLERAQFFLAAEQVEWNARSPELSITTALGQVGPRRDGARFLCVARDQRLLCSQDVIERWERDYAIVACSLSIDRVDDRDRDDSLLGREARERSASGILCFGRYPRFPA